MLKPWRLIKLIKCEICKKEFETYKSLTSHIRSHKVTSKEYYDKYLKKNENICLECGNKTNFENINKGYRKFCNIKCQHNSELIKKKSKNSLIKKYGIDRKSILEKTKKTCTKKYGCENVFQNEKIKKKIKQTNIEKYGVENPSKNNIIKNKKYDKRMLNFIPMLKKQLEYLDIKLLDEKYINCDYNHKWICLKCGYEFEQIWDRLRKMYQCPKCFPRNKSKCEYELLEFIESLNLDTIENDRKILNGKELDICIPSKNIAIEFNGLYWHSEEQGKDKNYHLNKTEECLKNNIKLIHIFEDEWIYNQEIVKSRLKQIFGLNNNLPKIYARKCEIKEIDSKIKNKFLNNFHIQGGDKSNIKLGAFYNDELISVMTFSHGNISRKIMNNKLCWELSRFCSNSNYHIPGIASKLLSYFKRNYKWKEIYSYADRRWSHGNVYKKIGFELDSITKPNYWYIKNGIRIHRFNLRKKYNEPKDIPEWVLRQKEGYYRIWDCGHYKFRIEMRSNFL